MMVFAGSRFATLTATSCSSVDPGGGRSREAGGNEYKGPVSTVAEFGGNRTSPHGVYVNRDQ